MASLVAAHVSMAGPFDLEIHCVAKKVSEDLKKASSDTKMGKDMYGQPALITGGGTNKKKEDWVYDVTIENKTFKDMANVEVKYLIFFKREKLGVKADPTPDRKAGSAAVGVLKAHEKKTITTDAVELQKANLVGEFHYASGAKINVQDTLTGVWVRVFQDGQQISEYANPSNLSKEKWE